MIKRDQKSWSDVNKKVKNGTHELPEIDNKCENIFNFIISGLVYNKRLCSLDRR